MVDVCLVQVTDSGITLIGYTDLPARLPTTASELFAKNLVNCVLSLSDSKQHKGAMIIDPEKVWLLSLQMILTRMEYAFFVSFDLILSLNISRLQTHTSTRSHNATHTRTTLSSACLWWAVLLTRK